MPATTLKRSHYFNNRFEFYDYQSDPGCAKDELIAGLTGKNKSISPKFLYDERGSRLFEKITGEPEYYPTRTEKAILREQGPKIAQRVGAHATLIEPGSGNSDKVRLLLDHLKPNTYVPLDISRDHLLKAAGQLAAAYPDLTVSAICADYTQALTLPESVPPQKRVAFYPGSTIGNFSPRAAAHFLTQIRRWVGGDGGLIIGVDLQKDPAILNAAYNDANGTTAAFNRNILNNVNAILASDFEPQAFEHEAHYNPDQHRVEMHLVSQREQDVNLDSLSIRLHRGERINTEHCYKYTVENFWQLAAHAGFKGSEVWQDKDALFSVHYLVAH